MVTDLEDLEPMADAVSSRVNTDPGTNVAGFGDRGMQVRIYDKPARAGWTDVLPVDNALQRQPNLTWPGFI
jgi:hypothetical protein